MKQEFIGYIKKTKRGKFRCVIASLVDVGEPDGDKLVNEVATSVMYELLSEAATELKSQCDRSGIKKISFEPLIRGQMLYESEIKL